MLCDEGNQRSLGRTIPTTRLCNWKQHARRFAIQHAGTRGEGWEKPRTVSPWLCLHSRLQSLYEDCTCLTRPAWGSISPSSNVITASSRITYRSKEPFSFGLEATGGLKYGLVCICTEERPGEAMRRDIIEQHERSTHPRRSL